MSSTNTAVQNIYLENKTSESAFAVNHNVVNVHIDDHSSAPTGNLSKRAKAKPVSRHEWSSLSSLNRQAALHYDRSHLAYVIHSSNEDIIRVCNRRTAVRGLIKAGGMNPNTTSSRVIDIAFSFSQTMMVLAYMDESGLLCIFQMSEDENETDSKTGITPELICKIDANSESRHRRLIWYPRPFAQCDEEGASILAVIHEQHVELWDIHNLLQKFGPGGVFDADEDSIQNYRVVFNSHDHYITDVALTVNSNDLIVGVANFGGKVLFSKVTNMFASEDDEEQYSLEREVKDMRTWEPYEEDGESGPVVRVIFLDDLTEPDADIWKYALTLGGVSGSTVKIWRCDKWSCIQTIKFIDNSIDPVDQFLPTPQNISNFKVNVDCTGQVICICDVSKRVLYLLTGSGNEDTYQIQNFTEILLTSPILDFVIVKCCNKQEQPDSDKPGMLSAQIICVHSDVIEELMIKYSFPTASGISSENTVPASRNSAVSTGDLRSNGSETNMSLGESVMSSLYMSSGVPLRSLTNGGGGALSSAPLKESAEVVDIDNNAKDVPFLTPAWLGDDPIKKSAGDATSVKSSNDAEALFAAVKQASSAAPFSAPPSTVLPRRSPGKSSNRSPNSMEVSNIFNGNDESGDENAATQQSTKNIPIALESEQNLPKVLSQTTISVNENEDSLPVNADNGTPVPFMSHFLNGTIKPDENQTMRHTLDMSAIQNAIDVSTAAVLEQLSSVKMELETVRVQDEARHEDVSLTTAKIAQDIDRLADMLSRQEVSVSENERVIRNVVDKVSEVASKQSKAGATSGTALSPQAVSQITKTLSDFIRGEISAQTDQVVLSLQNRLLSDDSFRRFVGEACAQSVSDSVKQVLTTTLIPAFDKSCSGLFAQVNDSFVTGTQTYLDQIATHKKELSDFCATQETKSAMQHAEFMKLLKASLDDINAKTAESSRQLAHQISSSNNAKASNGALSSDIQGQLSIIKKDISSQQSAIASVSADLKNFEVNLSSQMTSLTEVMNARSIATFGDPRSRPVTPGALGNFSMMSSTSSPHVVSHLEQKKMEINAALRTNDYHTAFSAALNAQNLTLLNWLCEMVTPEKVFSSSNTRPLDGHIILPLIHQLVSDLGTSTGTKVKYLQHAFLNLRPKDEIVKQHSQSILATINAKCSDFSRRHPDSKYATQVAIVKMSASGVFDAGRK